MQDPAPSTASTWDLPVHFFTIVLNGQPFIRYHLERFRRLPFAWHWHVIEGLADLKHDTAWSLQHGATLPTETVREGRSIDGTAEYLDQIAAEHSGNVTVYRAPSGRLWDGKLEMIAAPLARLPEEALLWEVDSDELWTTDQIIRMREMFLREPDRTAAVFYCWYFVAPRLVINRRRRYDEIEWRRAWRYRKGMRWAAHEPPTLAAPHPTAPGQWLDVTRVKPFAPLELERQGLVFQHYAYVTPEQLAFKETYYGYKGITAQWKAMQGHGAFPVALKQFFDWPWVHPRAQVEPVEACGIVPLATEEAGAWTFHDADAEAAAGRNTLVRGILLVVRHGGGGAQKLIERAINSARAVHPDLPIHLHQLAPGVQFVEKRELPRLSPFEETLFLDVDALILDRLDFGFEMAARHGLACCIAECPWVRRHGMGQAAGGGGVEQVEYHPGVLFFSRKGGAFFDRWAAFERGLPQALDGKKPYRMMTPADHVSFSLAIAEEARAPFILPSNWNFHPEHQRTWWGPIKIWREASDPPAAIVNFTKEQAKEEALIQYVSLG